MEYGGTLLDNANLIPNLQTLVGTLVTNAEFGGIWYDPNATVNLFDAAPTNQVLAQGVDIAAVPESGRRGAGLPGLIAGVLSAACRKSGTAPAQDDCRNALTPVRPWFRVAGRSSLSDSDYAKARYEHAALYFLAGILLQIYRRALRGVSSARLPACYPRGCCSLRRSSCSAISATCTVFTSNN